jgi:hypothetical protein
VKRLDTSDFPTERTWIGSLFLVLNDFIRLVYQLFDNGLTIKDNMKGMIFTVKKFKIESAVPNAAISFKSTLNVDPYAVIMGRVREYGLPDNAIPSIITSSVNIDWYYDKNKKQIYIQNVNGLTVGHYYTMNLIILGG